jgi:hypothetical protein
MRTLKIDSLLDSRVYVDRDVIMLHACFQILQDCIEKENVDTHCNYDDHKEFVDEVRFLYNWWLKRKDDIDFDNDAQDDEMLIRLMKIRSSLWT